LEVALLNRDWKWSTKMTKFVELAGMLAARGIASSGLKYALKRAKKRIQLGMLDEEARKAPMCGLGELSVLGTVTAQTYAVPLSLMLPTGLRFQDVANLKRRDVVQVEGNVVTLRVRKAKNIRTRKAQRFLTITIPSSLLQPLLARLEAAPADAPLVTVSYRQMLAFLKRTLGTHISTYSIRRGVFEQMRRRVSTIEEMRQVTLHADEQMLRWYLEAPLKDEADLQARVSAWHVGLSATTRPTY
jgi:integrase